MDESVVKELNAVLKGEHMALDAYERFIQEVDDDKVKNEFKNIQSDHRKHIKELISRIENLGGKPESSTGFAGFMASAKAITDKIGSRDTVDIIKNAYDGEDKGIGMVEEIIKGDLDNKSLDIVKGMLKEDHDHLKTMAHMISRYEH